LSVPNQYPVSYKLILLAKLNKSDICYIDEERDQLKEKQEEETGNFESKYILQRLNPNTDFSKDNVS
jgi:uncharacterized membrane protein YcaP (DUF421 family)